MSKPLIIMLPGMDGTGKLFSPLREQLQRDGFESTVLGYPTNEKLGYTELVSYIGKQLPMAREYILLGESFGGPLATLLAATERPMCKGLILAVTFLRLKNGLSPFTSGILNAMPSFRMPRSLTSLLMAGYGAPMEVKSELDGLMEELDSSLMRHRTMEALSIDTRAIFSTLHIPVLNIHASADCIVPARCQIGMGSGFNVTSKTLYGPHLLLRTSPEKVSSTISKWWEREKHTAEESVAA